MKIPKKTLNSSVYDKKYYTEFCRAPDDFSKEGHLSGYDIIFDLLSLKKGERFLEIGCGRGEVVHACSRLGVYSVGIDYSQDAVSLAKEECMHILRASATHLPFADSSFDKILLMEIIEHLDDNSIDACLSEVERVLKLGGFAVITTPNSWNGVLYFFVKLFRWAGFRVNWMSRDDPYHINVLNPFQLRRFLVEHGFTVKLFPRINYPSHVSRLERIKNRTFFLVKHLRCIAYKQR